MNFEELQQQWQAIKSEPRSHGELRSMMYASPAWRLKKVTVKEILRFCARAFALIVLIVLFDLFGSWSSGIFAAWSIFLFLDEYLGLRYLRFLRSPDDALAFVGVAGLARIAGFVVKNLTDDFLFRSNAKELWAMLAILIGLGTRLSARSLVPGVARD